MKATAHLVLGTLRTDMLVRDRFLLETDEPESVGGDDTAPAPHELLPAALAACVSTTVARYARTKGWELTGVRVDVAYDETVTPRSFVVDVCVDGAFSEEQLARLEKVAASCPVRRALEAGAVIEERVHSPALAR